MRGQTLVQLIEDKCYQNADKIFITEKIKDQLVNRTYAQVKSDIDKLARYLKIHIGSRKKIMLIGENSYQWILIYLSVIYSGNIIIPLDCRTFEKKGSNLIKPQDVSLLFLQSKYITDKIANEFNGKIIEISEDISGRLGEILNQNVFSGNINYSTELIQETDICTIMFTSGTTNESKGVVLTHRQLYSDICSFSKRMNKGIGERGYGVLPLFHAFALLCDLWRTIYLGSSFYILRNIKSFYSDLIIYNPDYMFLVPEIAENMLKELKKQCKHYPQKKKQEVGNKIWGEKLHV